MDYFYGSFIVQVIDVFMQEYDVIINKKIELFLVDKVKSIFFQTFTNYYIFYFCSLIQNH